MANAKKQFLIFHAVGILIFLCLPVLFLSNGPGNKSIPGIIGSCWYWIFCLLYIFTFYLNAYWLFPKLYLHKKYFLYALAVLVLGMVIYLIQPFDHIISFRPPAGPPDMDFINNGPGPAMNNRSIDFVSLFIYIVIVSVSVLIPVVNQWQKIQQQYLIMQKDKANAELSFLKAQINPHFLFNTLNNLYALSLTNNEKTPESILRLSNIMRYVTDEVHNDFVSLENEIACINDFIELHKLRLNNKTTIIFNHEAANENLYIAPLMLLPFVENVFKHGISNNAAGMIEIKIATKEKEIIFYSRNNVFNTVNKDKRQGTGINNVIKRLQNIYPGKHFLKTGTLHNIFEVHLIINS